MVLSLAVYGSLFAYHLVVKSAPLTMSARMAVDDFKVAAACPDQPSIVWGYVQRDVFVDVFIVLAGLFGEDWVAAVCDGADLSGFQPFA